MSNKSLVIVHFDEDGGGPEVYMHGDVEVILVCDYAPGDRFYRMSKQGVPKQLFDEMQRADIGHHNDGSVAEIRAHRAVSEMEGEAPLRVIDGGSE